MLFKKRLQDGNNNRFIFIIVQVYSVRIHGYFVMSMKMLKFLLLIV